MSARPLLPYLHLLIIALLLGAPLSRAAASEGPAAPSSPTSVPPPPRHTASTPSSSSARARTTDDLLAPDPSKRFAHYEAPPPEPPTRRGERAMIAGYSLLGAGLTITAVGITTAIDPLAPTPDPSAPDYHYTGHGYGLYLVAVPTMAVGSAVTLTGAALIGGGHGLWRRSYREWSPTGRERDPRAPLRTNPRRLIIPGALMLVTGPLAAGLCSLLVTNPFTFVPGGMAAATGATLLTVGLIERRHYRGRATAQLTPTAGRTRDGTWTAGLVVRW